MDKILFLDIDGVLNVMPRDRNIVIKWKNEMPKHDFQMKLYGLNKESVDLLKLIIERTGCKIVFSTSWRSFDDHPIVGNDWRKTLAEMLGMSKDIFIGNTPNHPNLGGWDSYCGRRRGLEIKLWITDNLEPGKFKYCVIDDEISDIIGVIPESRIVHTDESTGITINDVDRAVKILNGD